MAALWRPTGRGSHARPPPQRRLLILHAPDALAQELILHGQFGDDSLLSPALLVELGHWPGLERLSASRQQGATPLAKSGSRNAILAPRGLQIGARSRSRTTLALRLAERAALAAAFDFRLARRSPSGSLERARKSKHSCCTSSIPCIANQCPTKSCCGRARLVSGGLDAGANTCHDP